MACLERSAWCFLVVCLTCVHLCIGYSLEQICERRCLYQRGGILCNCNAMHFKGKRSDMESQHDRPGAHYLRGENQLLQGPSNSGQAGEKGRSNQGEDQTSGSQTSHGKSWHEGDPTGHLDLNSVNDIINGLRSLAQDASFSQKDVSVLEDPSVDLTRATSPRGESLPFLFFDGDSMLSPQAQGREISSDLHMPVKIRFFRKPSSAEAPSHQNDDDINDSAADTESHHADAGIPEAPKTGGASSAVAEASHLLRLRDLLKRALRGR